MDRPVALLAAVLIPSIVIGGCLDQGRVWEVEYKGEDVHGSAVALDGVDEEAPKLAEAMRETRNEGPNASTYIDQDEVPDLEGYLDEEAREQGRACFKCGPDWGLVNWTGGTWGISSEGP